MKTAELHNDLAEGPEGGHAWWLTTSDSVRIRVGGWGAGAPKGTILLFPGRTEYIEKYGRNAQDFLDNGYATLAVDWRGQGLADRLVDDRQAGHVCSFPDYQNDVQALIAHAEELGFKAPYFLVGHSMGGCIGFRALIEGLPVKAAIFTGPMWGINMPPILSPFARTITTVSLAVGLKHSYVPTSKSENYVDVQEFEGNQLTTDPEMYAYMQRQVAGVPSFGLGGPTIKWLHRAMEEIQFIMSSDAPDVPTKCYLGLEEKIVNSENIRSRMSNWPKGELIEVPSAEHEVLMETPEIRAQVANEICDFFESHTAA